MFAKTLNILLAECIKIPTDGLSPLLDRKIHERLVFTNPDYELRHNRGEWIGNIPPQISCIRQKGHSYLLPRGFLDQLLELCKRFQQPYRLVDRRRTVDPVSLEFHGELKGYQQDAAESALANDFATLVGGHKSGKTVIALYTIAQRCQPTLVLIPKLDLLDGWLTKIENFLQIPRSEVGIFAEGVHQPGNGITIGHTGEVMRYWRKIWDRIGYLIMDECQRCPSKVLTHLIPNFDCRYMLGLSNTTQRRDRLSRLVYYYIGDMVYTIDEKDAKEGRGIIHAHVVARTTEFEYPYTSRSDFDPMLGALIHDEERTSIIANDIEAELAIEPQPLLVLSSGEEQDQVLKAELSKRGIRAERYGTDSTNGDEPPNEENQNDSPCPELDPASGPMAVLLTPQTLTKCYRSLSPKVLFLATPLYFRQDLANALRDMPVNGAGSDRRLRIYDYVDRRIGLL
ncbi:MAG TPA: hypothetical protein PKV86_09725, partial [Syntrophobacteraceae bacterium]|nr:hypothetical protein [Syntrophobacteraceae bacterium]